MALQFDYVFGLSRMFPYSTFPLTRWADEGEMFEISESRTNGRYSRIRVITDWISHDSFDFTLSLTLSNLNILCTDGCGRLISGTSRKSIQIKYKLEAKDQHSFTGERYFQEHLEPSQEQLPAKDGAELQCQVHWRYHSQ